MNKCKPKPCRNCLTVFQPYNSLQQCCNIPCSVAYTRMKAEKAEKRRQKAAQAETNRSHREARERLRTRSDWLSLAQIQFNKFIRLRDRGLPCISCDKPDNGQHQRHSSHFRSIGSAPECRFLEDNAHASCSQCNNWLSGNLSEYEPRLIKKIGQQRVDALKGPHDPLRLQIDEIKAIKVKYAKLARDLEKQQ